MNIVRSMSFIGVCICGLFFNFWIFIPVAFLYAFVYGPYEILVLGVCIDGVFGDSIQDMWYLYTLTASCIMLVTSFVRPYIRFSV